MKKLTVAFSLIFPFCALFAAELSQDTLLRLPPMAKTPVIDGKVDIDEWMGASQSFGGFSDKTKLMTYRISVYYFGYDSKNVYFALRSEIPDPPMQLTEKDAVELTIQAPGAANPQTFKVNAMGKGNLPNGAKFAGHFECKNHEYGYTYWETEMSIPISALKRKCPFRYFLTGALGLKEIRDGEKWGLQMTRYWDNREETGRWHQPAIAGELATFIPDGKSPSVSLYNLGDGKYFYYESYYTFRFSIANPTKSVLFAFSGTKIVTPKGGENKLTGEEEDEEAATMKKADMKFNDRVDAGKTVHISRVEYSGAGIHTIKADFSSSENGTVFYKRTLKWDLRKAVKWYDPVGLPSMDARFYPTCDNKFFVSINRNKIENVASVTVTIKDASGKTVKSFNPPWSGKVGRYMDTVQLPELPLGKYVACMDMVDANGKHYSHEKTFSVEKFEWQTANVGIAPGVIIPPFKPLKVDKAKNEVHALLTGYEIGGALWNTVYAEGENILASPVELTINGEKFTPGKIRLVSQASDRVVYESDVSWKNLKLTAVHDYDYDGFCKITLKFNPEGKVVVDDFTLNVSLKSQFVSLYDVPFRAGDNHSKGARDFALPKKDGELWNSLMEKESGIWNYGVPVEPYFWFGGIYKGFCWITDVPKHFSNDPAKPVQTLVRKGDVVTFLIAFVNKPTVWNKPFEMEMGFQATPVKPQAKGFLKSAQHLGKYLCPKNANLDPLNRIPGLPLSHGEFDMPNDDYNLWDYLFASRGKPLDQKAYIAFLKEYVNRNADYFTRHGSSPEGVLGDWAFWWRALCSDHMLYYADPKAMSSCWPETEMYKGEWADGKDNYSSAYDGSLTKSNIDRMLFAFRNVIRRGGDGIYYDCFSFRTSRDPVAGSAYRMDDGVLVHGFDMLEWRSLVKRTATMLYLEKRLTYGAPWVCVHSSNSMVVPVASFASTILTWERGGQGGDYQNRFPEGFVLSDTIGTQAGVMPFLIISSAVGDTARRVHELRTAFSLMCAYGIMKLHEQNMIYDKDFDNAWNTVFNFGFGDPDVQYLPFWGYEKQPVVCDAKDVRMTVLVRKDGRALILVGNLGDQVKATFDVSGLCYKNFTARDACSGKEIAKNANPSINIERHGYALIEIDDLDLLKKNEALLLHTDNSRKALNNNNVIRGPDSTILQ